MKLTNESVAALKLDGKRDLIVFDDATPGFAYRLRAGANGKTLCSWVLQYRKAGASRRYKLGPAGPGALSAEKARALAKEALAKIWAGQDPSADRAARRDADKLTFAKAVGEFLETKRRHLRPNTFAETSRYLTSKRYFGALHSMPLDTITRQDIAHAIKTIERESGAATAGQARAKLSGFFAEVMQDGLVDTNPVIGARKPPANRPRERVLSDQELVAIWKACGDDDYGRVVKLLFLTACRREEIGGMMWGEFEPDGTSWTLPAARAKNHRPLTLPMLGAMRAILDTVPRLVGREHLFGERSTQGFQSWDLHKKDLEARSDITGWQLRDIRRSVATKMADLGIMPHVIEQILNHMSGHKGGVAGIYNRSSYEREVRAALAQWHDHLRTLVEGGERKVLAYPTGMAKSDTNSATA
jgi:integrase